jgi:hypothetical protein
MKPSMKIKATIPSLFIVFTVGWLALPHRVQAVSPAPDGGYPGGNTAEGQNALFSLTTGGYNTGNGWNSLHALSSGSFNTAFGAATLFSNTGANNTATGAAALFSNTTESNNTANGTFTLLSNTEGPLNTAIGFQALYNNTTSGSNTATGVGALAGNTTGNDTSRRFKEDIKPMSKASDMILALTKPVTFHYKKEIDPKGIPQFGLVAEDVEAVNPDLVVRDKEGKVNTVRYDAINAMLLNEFLKEHRKVQEQEATIAEQKRDHQLQIDNLVATVAQQQMGMENLAAQLKGQAAQIQKVSMQLQLSKAVPQTVLNNQ